MEIDTESLQGDSEECDPTADRAADNVDQTDLEEKSSETKTVVSSVRAGLIIVLLVVSTLAGLVGWLGFTTYQTRQAQQQRALFLRVGRQGALNLTTISYTHVDADVRRILDSSTGTFHDDFQKRSQPFIDVVKQAQSTTEGSITEAGIESVQGDQAQILVAVSVKTSNAGAAQQEPRAWRMRIAVHKAGDAAKVSNVEFVP